MVMEIIVRANVVVSAHQTLIVDVFVVAEKIMEEIKIRKIRRRRSKKPQI